jgi:Zn-dependent protease/predicted transcriptional regulator
MNWSFRIGRWFGIDVFVHFTFVLVLGFLAFAHWMAGRELARVVEGVLFFLALFGCVLLHEFGHALMARRYGVQTRDIILLPIGGVARLERIPAVPRQEFWIALAGPAVNLVIAGVLALFLTVAQAWQPVAQLSPTAGGFAERLLLANGFLIAFNLLPAFPMDGGRVLRALLAMRLGFARATRIAATLGQGMAFLFALVGVLAPWPMLLLIALFVWIGAAQEAGAAQFKSNLAGVTVERAMMTQFATLAPHDSLARAVDLILAGSQQDFPVVEAGAMQGVLTRKALLAALARQSPATPVGEVMAREFEAVDAADLVEDVVARGRSQESVLLPVLRHGELVGLLTLENLTEYVAIQAALRERRTG